MRSRAIRSEDGFTLVELTVVVFVMSIISFMMLNFLDNTSTVVSLSGTSSLTEIHSIDSMSRMVLT